MKARIARRRPPMEIAVILDERTTAKVVAGMSRVRIRPGATFASSEAEGLWHHEIETHALTAHNGACQVNAPFLRSGGPRTTRTQEGLAVFSELYNRTLSVQRLERLAVRVKLVDMAEQGASFLDLHRYLVGLGATAARRLFRRSAHLPGRPVRGLGALHQGRLLPRWPARRVRLPLRRHPRRLSRRGRARRLRPNRARRHRRFWPSSGPRGS